MRALLILAILVAAPRSAVAEHCESWSTSQPEVDTGLYYVDYDPPCQTEAHCWGVWVYEESNGHRGLQRGDEFIDDTCHAMIPADTIVF